MAALVTEGAIERGFDIAVVTEPARVRDALVIVHKTMMGPGTVNMMARLKGRGCTLIADPIDGKFEARDFKIYDAVVSASFAQLEWLRKHVQEKPSYFVNQRLDSRLPQPCESHERFRIGYFGGLENCAHREEIEGMVDLVDTPTKVPDWMNELPKYAAHYAVRPVMNGVFKPFGKGYLAGYYGAPMVVGYKEPDAMFLLPADYPFWVEEARPAETVGMLKHLQSSFRSAEWEYAVGVMKQVSALATDRSIEEQFFNMVSEISRNEYPIDTNTVPQVVLENLLFRSKRKLLKTVERVGKG